MQWNSTLLLQQSFTGSWKYYRTINYASEIFQYLDTLPYQTDTCMLFCFEEWNEIYIIPSHSADKTYNQKMIRIYMVVLF
jgi:hypothetical protein